MMTCIPANMNPMNPMNHDTPTSRHQSIINLLRALRPILEEKEIISTVIRATELAKICRNHHRRLPNRSYRALDLADEINGICGGLFVLDDLEIQVYQQTDFETGRRRPSIEFQRAVSLEQQYLNSLKEKEEAQNNTNTPTATKADSMATQEQT
jgi:hypothetical protein